MSITPEFSDDEIKIVSDTLSERYGTGRNDYDDIFECTATLLHLQADRQAQRSGSQSGRK